MHVYIYIHVCIPPGLGSHGQANQKVFWDFKELERPGTSWDELGRPGMRWDDLRRAGTWDELRRPGTSCDKLERAGTAWDKLARPGVGGHHPSTERRMI